MHINQVAAGLAVSAIPMLVSLQVLCFQNRTPDDDVLIDGTGLLHTMWLSRNHPELETLMDHVDHPTDKNLREAGMVQTRLVGGNLRKRGVVNPSRRRRATYDWEVTRYCVFR